LVRYVDITNNARRHRKRNHAITDCVAHLFCHLTP
jgi:hypothetical protein